MKARRRLAGRIARSAATLGLALVLLAARPPAARAAEEPAAATEDGPKVVVDFMFYGWIPGNYGTVRVKDTTVQIDVTPIDLLELMFDGNAFGGAGYLSVAYDRFSAFADTMGGYAKESVAQTIPTQLCTLEIGAKDKLKFVIADFAVGYQLGQWSLPKRRHPLTLGVYAGTRYMFFSNELEAKAGVVHGAAVQADVFESFAWADPLVGLRWSAPLLDRVSVGSTTLLDALTFDFRGDIGGFGASSELIWGLVGVAKLWLPWTPLATTPYLSLGYRAAAFDRGDSEGSIDLQMRGPLVGAGFAF